MVIEGKNLILAFFLILSLGCLEPMEFEKGESLEHLGDSIQKKSVVDIPEVVPLSSETFHSSIFKQSIDSFLVDFTGVETSYQLTIDTIIKPNTQKILHDENFLLYLVNKSSNLIDYSFDDKETENLDFRILELNFTDSAQCSLVFKKIKEYAITNRPIDNFKYVPCLTYENDRVLVGKQKIFWLNNSCKFSFKTHKDYLAFLRQSIVNFSPTDSILCKCDEVVSRR